jgi:hypothetical protein
VFADEIDIHLLPKVGYEWTPKGEEREVMTAGCNQKRYLAGALDWRSGRVLYRIGRRKTSALFVELRLPDGPWATSYELGRVLLCAGLLRCGEEEAASRRARRRYTKRLRPRARVPRGFRPRWRAEGCCRSAPSGRRTRARR